MPELPITPKQMAELMKLAGTDAGKQLLSLLQREKGPELRQALNRQDYTKAKTIVREFMEEPEVRALLRQLGR